MYYSQDACISKIAKYLQYSRGGNGAEGQGRVDKGEAGKLLGYGEELGEGHDGRIRPRTSSSGVTRTICV